MQLGTPKFVIEDRRPSVRDPQGVYADMHTHTQACMHACTGCTIRAAERERMHMAGFPRKASSFLPATRF